MSEAGEQQIGEQPGPPDAPRDLTGAEGQRQHHEHEHSVSAESLQFPGRL